MPFATPDINTQTWITLVEWSILYPETENPVELDLDVMLWYSPMDVFVLVLMARGCGCGLDRIPVPG